MLQTYKVYIVTIQTYYKCQQRAHKQHILAHLINCIIILLLLI